MVRTFPYRGAFCTHYDHFPEGKPAVLPGLERAFERDKGDKSWPDIKAQVEMGFFTNPSSGIREIRVLIPSAEYAKMEKGTPCTLHAVNGRPGYQWKVKGGLTFTRE